MPATLNWIKSNNTCKTKMTRITFKNIVMTVNTCPLTVIFKKIPKIWSGNKGIITASIRSVMISLKSLNPSFSVLPGMWDNPIPKIKESNRAPITSIIGGISIVK